MRLAGRGARGFAIPLERPQIGCDFRGKRDENGSNRAGKR